MNAIELLERAAGHMRDRAATYDKPEGERSMGRTVVAFNAITGRDLTEPEGWLLLQLLKDVRLFQRPGYHADSAEDCIAYAALKAESKATPPEPTNAGWIYWNGGSCPVPPHQLVEYRVAGMDGDFEDYAGELFWEHLPSPGLDPDFMIVAYRVKGSK